LGIWKARVPWASLSEQQDDYLDSEYLPDGLELKEPSKIHRNDITMMITHWKKRQDDAEVDVTFRFMKVQELDKNLIGAVLPHSQAASRPSRPSAATDRGRKGKGTGKAKAKGKGKQAKKVWIRLNDSAPEEDEIRQALNDVDGIDTSDEEQGRAWGRGWESSDGDIDLKRYLRPDQETDPEHNEDEAEAEEHRPVMAQKSLLKPKPKPKQKSQPKPKPPPNVQPESDTERLIGPVPESHRDRESHQHQLPRNPQLLSRSQSQCIRRPNRSNLG